MTDITLRILRQAPLGFPDYLLHGWLITVMSEIWLSSYHEFVFTVILFLSFDIPAYN